MNILDKYVSNYKWAIAWGISRIMTINWWDIRQKQNIVRPYSSSSDFIAHSRVLPIAGILTSFVIFPLLRKYTHLLQQYTVVAFLKAIVAPFTTLFFTFTRIFRVRPYILRMLFPRTEPFFSIFHNPRFCFNENYIFQEIAFSIQNFVLTFERVVRSLIIATNPSSIRTLTLLDLRLFGGRRRILFLLGLYNTSIAPFFSVVRTIIMYGILYKFVFSDKFFQLGGPTPNIIHNPFQTPLTSQIFSAIQLSPLLIITPLTENLIQDLAKTSLIFGPNCATFLARYQKIIPIGTIFTSILIQYIFTELKQTVDNTVTAIIKTFFKYFLPLTRLILVYFSQVEGLTLASALFILVFACAKFLIETSCLLFISTEIGNRIIFFSRLQYCSLIFRIFYLKPLILARKYGPISFLRPFMLITFELGIMAILGILIFYHPLKKSPPRIIPYYL
jgi:hypothetical protein